MTALHPDRKVAAVILALRTLIAADNYNYQRDTMRYAGFFDQARAALRDLTGEDLPHTGFRKDPLLCALEHIAHAESSTPAAELQAIAARALDIGTW